MGKGRPNRIQRRKEFVLSRQLRKKFPGYFKVCSNFGWGDGSTLERDLTIDKALKYYFWNRRYKSGLLIDNIGGAGDVHQIMDTTNTYYIVENDVEQVWEREDYDWRES